MRWIALSLLLALAPAMELGRAAGAAQPDAAQLAWTQHPGAQVPMQSVLRDASGRAVRLAQMVSGTPAILDLGYYRCPSLCGTVRADLLGALRQSGLRPDQYALLVVSIDPAEAPPEAARAQAADLASLGMAAAPAWHYLTGDAAPVIRAVGYHDLYRADLRQFLHPVGLVVLTPQGIVSSYLLGVGYTGGDLRAAVLRAQGGLVARAALPILLVCFHFDPLTGRYTLAVVKLLQLAGAITVLTLGGLVLLLHRRTHQA
jgi:protein SCO1/2